MRFYYIYVFNLQCDHMYCILVMQYIHPQVYRAVLFTFKYVHFQVQGTWWSREEYDSWLAIYILDYFMF